MSQITNLSVSDGQNFQLALQSKSSTLNFVIIAPFAAFQMVWNAEGGKSLSHLCV
ncbi:hypothetical protein T08_9112 [Trichinella sp. T8]|nr:hypothetical protein T08_9112 [Trichinella sp. T8]